MFTPTNQFFFVMEEKTKAPFWKPALIYGLIVGFVSILVSVIFYFLGLSLSRWTSWVSLAVTVVVLVYVLLAYRNEYLGGYASYGKIFLMSLAVGIISSILGAIYTYLLYNVIDPEMADKTRIMAEEGIMNNKRLTESMKEDWIERMDGRFTTAKMVRTALIWGIIISTILGLIISAFVKKEEKIPAQVS